MDHIINERQAMHASVRRQRMTKN